jgi:hypothetical protein
MLRQEVLDTEAGSDPPQTTQGLDMDRNSIFFKGNRMYIHHLARFNYTTYDVRRSQDVINPGTSHRDIILLANNTGNNGDSNHPFLYARVLGIYHVNVIYTGEGSLDYAARRMEFLWVRWFEYDAHLPIAWTNSKLDPVRFLPMSDERAFGFVDPNHVLRGCHIVPTFVKGKARVDGISLSRLVRDGQDWSQYRVNR